MYTVFVGNLPFQITAEDLKNIFKDKFVVLNAKVITDKYSGNSRGFGFLEVQTEKEIDAQVSELNNLDFNQNRLIVKVSKIKFSDLPASS